MSRSRGLSIGIVTVAALAVLGALPIGRRGNAASCTYALTQLAMTLNALCGRYDRPGGMNRNEGALGRTYGLEMQGVPLHKPPVSRVRGILAINGLSAMADPNPRCDDRGSCRSDTGS